MTLPNIAQEAHKVEAYGRVTYGPGTVQLVITFGPEADPMEVEICRKAVAEALKQVVRETSLHPLTEQILHT